MIDRAKLTEELTNWYDPDEDTLREVVDLIVDLILQRHTVSDAG